MRWYRLSQNQVTRPFSTDVVPRLETKEDPWKPSELRVEGDAVYDGDDLLIRITDPDLRDEFVLDYSTAPDAEKPQIWNQWREKMAPKDKGEIPLPEAKRKKGEEDVELEVSSGKWEGKAYSRRIFIKKKVPTSPGEKEKSTSIPVYVSGIEMTYVPTGETFKFPYQERGGIGTFGDQRPTTQTVKPRYKPSEMVALLTKWVGKKNAEDLVSSALG